MRENAKYEIFFYRCAVLKEKEMPHYFMVNSIKERNEDIVVKHCCF